MNLEKNSFKPALNGPDYYTVLSWLHERLPHTCYVEIGVREGRSLALASSYDKSIGVDPNPQNVPAMPPNATIVPLTSDEFFLSAHPTTLLARDPFAFAFIDGMHLFDQVLKDFANLEKFGRRNSVIAIHDCVPQDELTSSRERRTAFFTGDVWKAVVCLKEWRHDLSIVIVPTPPTGLCLITNLDPCSSVLLANWEKIVNQYAPMTYEDYERRYCEMFNTIENSTFGISTWLHETSGRKFEI